jgi:hypothetical protein
MSTGKQMGIIALAVILMIFQIISLVYMPGSVANPEADKKYKNLSTADIQIPAGMAAGQFLGLILIIVLAVKLFKLPKMSLEGVVEGGNN